jgi:hypothetical protein
MRQENNTTDPITMRGRREGRVVPMNRDSDRAKIDQKS